MEKDLKKDLEKDLMEGNDNSDRAGTKARGKAQGINMSEADDSGVRYYTAGGASYADGGPGSTAAPAKNNRFRNNLIVLGIIIVIIAAIGVGCNSATNRIIDKALGGGTGPTKLPSSPYIATLYVEGVIQSDNTDYFGSPIGYQHQWTLDEIDELIHDPDNRGLMIFVDSPGGGVYESDELYMKIKEYKEETGNPVYSVMGSMAASGGYYISAPCDKIIANRNCWTGSIGVLIGTIYDFSGLMERYGIKATTITSGPNKAMGDSTRPMTPEQKAIFQSLVDEAYDQFVGIVAEGRNMKVARVKEIADGRIYTAKQAMDIGLIDDIGTLEDAAADMQDLYDLDDCEIVDITPEEEPLFRTLFGAMSSIKSGGISEVEVLLRLAEKKSSSPVSYICETLIN